MSAAVSQRVDGGKKPLPIENGILPEVRPRSSEMQIDTTKPLPTSLQSDFIPDDVLFALTQPPVPQDQLGPLNRLRNLGVSNDKSRKKPANVWNFPKRREKFKHLTDSTACNCGAGRDISFLYDVPVPDIQDLRPDSRDMSLVRRDEPPKKSLQLQDTLIPEEYHIVKNKGVQGLEYHDEKYTTATEDHDKHLVVFPSMKPTSRFEVIQLKNTMQQMLHKLGFEDLDIEVRGPTQMHNLLELIKKEQNIYNTIFHELIRQTSVECAERGELLAELRNKYSDLLNKVPKQIKSLHEEVLSQRALDRRLTEELMKFKSTISVLTDELAGVKEHDRIVTRQAAEAQEDLKAALAESQKNASLLSEYHGLYELQRKRLETQVNLLTTEKELWSTAAYSLALKVTEEHQLNTANRLHISEKSWCKLANHFTILLSDKDTELLTVLQGNVESWREMTTDFNKEIKTREMEMAESLKIVKSGILKWIEIFKLEFMNKDGQLNNPPDMDKTGNLLADIRGWEEHLAKEMEKFGGEHVLSMQDMLQNITKQMEQWTDCAIKVFTRHRKEEQNEANHPHISPMHTMNDSLRQVIRSIEELVHQYTVRLLGENGTAKGVIHLMNSLETWNNKLNTVLHGSNQLKEQQWVQFYQLMDDWAVNIDFTVSVIGSTQKEEDQEKGLPHKSIDVTHIFKLTQKWMTGATNAIDSEDAKLVEEVTTLHTEMVKWMVQMLLRLAPDRESNSKESHQMALLGSTSISLLKTNVKSLCETIDNFSKYVTQCCHSIVYESMQRKLEAMEEYADTEMRDLKRLKTECNEWIHTASLLLQELTGDPIDFEPTASTITIASIPVTPATTTPGVPHTPQVAPTPSTPAGLTQTPAVPPTPPMQINIDKEKLSREETGLSQLSLPEVVMTPVIETTAPPTETADASQVKPDDETVLSAEPTEDDATVTETEQTEGGDTLQEEKKEGDTSETPGGEKHVTIQDEPTHIVEAIGRDESTHPRELNKPTDGQAPIDEGVFEVRPDTPNTKKAFEALAAVSTLQNQLIDTETRAQAAEERAEEAENALKKAQEQLRILERKLATTPEEDPNETKQEQQKGSTQDPAQEKSGTVTKVEATSSTKPRVGSAKDESLKKITIPTPPAADAKRPESRSNSRAGSKTGHRSKKK